MVVGFANLPLFCPCAIFILANKMYNVNVDIYGIKVYFYLFSVAHFAVELLI